MGLPPSIHGVFLCFVHCQRLLFLTLDDSLHRAVTRGVYIVQTKPDVVQGFNHADCHQPWA